jgi:hypothetical protein
MAKPSKAQKLFGKLDSELNEHELRAVIAHDFFEVEYANAQLLNRAEAYREIHGDAIIAQVDGIEIGPDGKLRLTDEPVFDLVPRDGAGKVGREPGRN